MGFSEVSLVEDACPVCQDELPDGTEHCPRCGFPTSLRGAIGGPIAVSAPAETEVEPVPFSAPPPPRPEPSPEAEVNASLARALLERTELLRTVDQDAPDVTGELCEAALNEAAGRFADAQQILRSAQGRLEREAEELLSRHLSDLQERYRALESTGLHVAVEDELTGVAESLRSGDPASAIARLTSAERRLGRLEADWRGLQALIAQVVTLRAEAEQLGIRLDVGAERLESARANLVAGPATEREIDLVAQAAAATLMKLHEAIPSALEAELDGHRKALEAHPARHRKAQVARRLHAEASQHLSEGRLDSAVGSVRELRTVLADLAREAKEAEEEAARAPPARVPAARAPPAPAAPPPASVEVPGPAGEEPPAEIAPDAAASRLPRPSLPVEIPEPPSTPVQPPVAPPAGPPAMTPEGIASLMTKARSLASRIRNLPADSPEATEAARQIHDVTELLRSRRFAEADAALTRLMRALAFPPSRS